MTKLLLISAWILSCVATCLSQTSECRDEWPGHKVRSVKVKARWLPDDLDLPMKKGDDFTPEKLEATRAAVIKAINHEQDKYAIEFVKLDRLKMVDVKFVRGCGRKLPASTCQAEGLGTDCVDVEMKPVAVSTNPVFMAATLL